MADRKPEDFVHLHVHADTSLLDGFGTIPEMVAEATRIGQKAIAVTDHGNMHGVYDLYTHATAAGLKPIAGIEAYMAPSIVNRKHRGAAYFAEGGRGDVSGRGAYTHITLLAENNEGLHNLYKMGLLSYTEGFFQKNRIDLELLAEYGKGIIATTGCPSGEIQTRLRLGQKAEAYTFAGKLQDALGKENVFLELMEHGMKSDLERGVRGDLLELAKKLNIPLLATNDVHYTTQNQAHSHEEFLCVQTRSVMSTPPDHSGGTRFAFEGNSYYLKTAQEMADLFPDLPEALNNTLLIAERSNISIEPDPNLRPKIDIPDGLTEEEYIHREAIEGLRRRQPTKADNPEYLDRLETELNILKMKDYVGYFLVVSDFVRWAKNNNVPVGYGRGCLSGDSQILTPQGFKPLQDIEAGDTVFDEKGNQVKIPNKMEYNCHEELIQIKSFYGGNGNKMTADHKVLISKANPVTNKSKLARGIRFEKETNPVEWVRADEVKKGDYVVIPRLKFDNTTEGWHIEKTSTSEPALKTSFIQPSYEAGVLFGLFISDGWIRSDNRATVGFAQRRSQDEDYIPNIIKKVFGIKPTHQDHNNKDLRQYYLNHKGVHKLFQSLFSDYEFNASTKYIPNEFFNTPEEFRKGLLQGLWYGDGSHIGKTKYTTRSLRLAQGVHTLLLSLGLPAGIKSTQRRETRKGYRAAEAIEYSVTTAHHFNVDDPNPSVTFRKDENFLYYRVRDIKTVPSEGKVYDFTVPTTNSYVTDSYIVHNSAGGSLVAYCLDITDIDPIKYNLLFERFINPERDSPPDIDMDFNDTDRERVIEYVRNKYGVDQVAQIVTFGKIGAKAAIKDSIRIKEMPYATGEALSKALPEPVSGKAITLKEVYDPNADRYPEAGEFRDLVKKIDAENVIETAKNFEGRTRSTGVHAAALVVSSKPVVESVPMMQRQNDGAMITQWDYPTSEYLGLLKVDFLGLRNLGIIANTIKHVEKTRGEKIDLYKIIDGEMDDPKTYQLLAKGDSNGVFQLDSCLSGDTLVSGRKIKDLYAKYKKGEGIQTTYSIDLSTGKRVRNKILRFVESGIKPVYRLVSESGRMVEATEDHKFMTDSGWKRLGDININVDKVLVDQTVKTLMYRECVDCNVKLNSEKHNNSERCYKCSATYHSNPSKKISREAMAAARQKFYAEGGEPWNKGLTKETSPSLAVVAEKVRQKLNGRNIHQERMTEEEYKTYLEQLSIRMSGKNNPMYGKTTRISKKGYREDLGHYVRSTWEADYARVLNFLEEPYKYEYKTFELTREDGSRITYTPDFYLPNQNKYVEIKGFMRHIDAEKIKLVQEQHGIKLEVIQQSEFAELQMTYKDLLNWECPQVPETTEWEAIQSINFISEQMTYDISMKAPLNNFLANGFMVHNSGMQSLMKQLKPTEFNDIAALLALYRPGPMGVGAHVDYALRKNGEQKVDYIHPELEEPLKDILNETYGLCIYQEEIMLIAQKVANYTLSQADNLRRAMGKKKKSVLDAEYVPFSEGMRKNGYSEEAIKDLWDILVPFADYGFNKCVSDKTVVRMADGSSKSIREIYNMFNRGEEVHVQSMWPDGEVKPHKVANVVSTGMKEVYRLKTKNGRTIDLTPEHRLLTTRGYLELQNIVVGEDELIVADKIYSQKQIENAVKNIRKAHGLDLTEAQINARRLTMSKWNASDSDEKKAQDKRASIRMKKYQAQLTFEDRSRHQKYVETITDRGVRFAAAGRKRRAELWETDQEFRTKVVEHLARVRRDGYNSGPGFGKTCFASNGMKCDSLNEKRMAEFLIENDINFEMHKPVGKGECDFYFEGLYWEMDGMDRHISYFENKYGDIPFIVVTPEDYQERIADVLKLEHVRNGDLVISVEKINRKLSTIDIEMAEGGPKNYLTWKGIVSHNSHSVGYGMLSYLTAYFKANYPAEFMSALLSSVADDSDRTALYLNDCRNMGITVDPPNINESNVDYDPASADHIHFGFKAIRGVGVGVAEEIVAVRGNRPFKDFNDFISRIPKTVANKRILEALALGGAFDSLGVSRKSVVEHVPELLKELTKIHKKAAKAVDEVSLFDLTDEFNVFVPDVGEWGKLEKLKKERHALGLYVSGHPLEGLDMSTAGGTKIVDLTSGAIPPMQGWIPKDARPLKISGIVTALSKKRTKKGETFALGTVEDLTGTIPFVMFPKAFKDFGEFLQLDGVYQLSGFHRERDIDGISFTVDALRPLEFSETGKLSFRVKLTEKQYNAAKHVLLEKLQKHEAHGEGATNVIVSIKNESGDVWEEQLDIMVKGSPVLSQEVREVFGMLSIGRWRKSD